MARVARTSSALVLGFIVVVALLTRGTMPVSGQAPAAAAPPSAEQIAPFVGNWAVTLAIMANQVTMGVDVKNDGGTPSVTVRSQGQPDVVVKDISVSGKSLVLKYVMQAFNNALSAVLTITPDGASGRATMAVMDGQYEMTGSARKLAPGETVQLTAFGGGGDSSPISELTDFTPKPP
ncbi:MAG TPA: hypothetical protein VHB78_10115, partial [Vicinamibacterales bacterium]|nr:hypothetical protein [Vicinamibacterales bacterium]